MKAKRKVLPVNAPHGEKTIEFSVRLFTNEIAKTKGQVLLKHAWSVGIVHLISNKTHGIDGTQSMPFKSIADIGRTIEKLAARNGITFHSDLKPYLVSEEETN